MRNNSMSLRQIIVLSMATSLVLAAVLLGVATLGFNRAIDASKREHEVTQAAMIAMLDARFRVVQVQQFLTDVGATGDRGGFDEAAEQYDGAKRRLQEIGGLTPAFAGEVTRIGEALDVFYDIGRKMAEAYVVDGQDAGNVLMKQPGTGFDARAETLTEQIEGLEASLRSLMQQSATDTETALEHSRTLVLALGAGAMLLTVGAAFLLHRSLRQLLGADPEVAKRMVESIANGDLKSTVELRAGDTSSLMAFQARMQEALRMMVGEIASSVRNAEQSSRSLGETSRQVAAASHAASESAAAMAAGMEQMSVSIGHVSDDTEEALGITARAEELANHGGEVIGSAVAAINRMAESVRETASGLESLNRDSQQITAVVQVIKEVADQTNLLALNAAIEAARAGEQGRGFAVVADEVRKLAERTAQATTEINQTVLKVQADTRSSAATMEATVAGVAQGVDYATKAGAALAQIRDSVHQVVRVMNDIANAIREQNAASQQIAQRVESVAQAAEENNAAAQQMAESTRQLDALAESLGGSIRRFRI